MKIEQKSRKGENFISKLIGAKPKEPKASLSFQEKLLAQQDQMKREQELQMAEYQRVVRESQLFRTTYAAKMTEIIDQSEKSIRVNVETVGKCISDFA